MIYHIIEIVGTPMYGSKFFAPTAAAIELGDRMLIILLALTDSIPIIV
jgi:hypothetical protein